MAARIVPTVEDFRQARALVVDALTEAETAFPTEREAVVELSWGGDASVVDALDGASGFTSYPNRIELAFNTETDSWRDSLRSTATHEYAHVWGYDRRGRESETKWEYVIEEAFTQHIAARLVPEYESPWWTRFTRREVADYWDRITDELDDPSEDGERLYVSPGGEGYPLGLGYSLSYQIGERLLERHDLRSFPALDKTALLRAGEELYES